MNNEIKFLPPFKRMCMTIGTLPSSFYSSMSYYESMVWLYEYLKNEVIPVVNNNSEVAQELQTAFTTLENYIENYFENLDIQEEVNTKLDEMAEDGTLADIVAEYVRMQGQLVYNTVAEMKAAENIRNGSFLKTYGYYTVGDHGSALYKARTITNEDVIDDATIIALHDVTLVAELIIYEEMNSKCFGIKGDGLTDESDIIQKAINTTNIIFNKNESYNVSKTIYITHSINGNNSIFNIPLNESMTYDSALGIFIINQPNILVKNCKFISLYTDYTQKIPYVSANLLPPLLSCVDGSDGSKIEGCLCQNTNGHSIQVYGNTVKNIIIENCSAIDCGCGVGIEQINNELTDTPSNITINNFYSKCNNACEITSGSGIAVNNSYFESNGYGRGVVTTNEAYHDTHVDFNGCYFGHTNVDCSEANSKCILIDSYGSVKNVFVNFTSCILKGDITNVKTISLSTLAKASFISCEIEGQILLKGNSAVDLINSKLSGSVRNTNLIVMETDTTQLNITNSSLTITSPTADIWTKGRVNILNSKIDSSTNSSITCKDTSNIVIINSVLSKITNNENLYRVQMINSSLTNDTRFITNLGTIIGAVNNTSDLANIPATTSNMAMILIVTSKKVVYKYGNDWYYLDGTIVS